MQFYYEGKDITQYVNARTCFFSDYAGGKLDTLVIELEDAKAWHRWKPQPDDRIEVTEGAYTTGTLYLSAPAPEDDRFTIIATGAPMAAKRRGWENFRIRTIGEIFNMCAAGCGMKWTLFGIDPNMPVPYIERENETYLSFLQRLMTMEGGTLKCVNGKLTGIAYTYAQDLKRTQTVEILSEGQGTSYIKQPYKAIRSLTVKTLFASAQAVDSAVQQGDTRVYTNLPALSDVQAGRWARGMLISNNRQIETVCMESEFNQGMTALAHIDVTGDTEASGEWLVEKVKHDFVNRASSVEMHRCIRTVY